MSCECHRRLKPTSRWASGRGRIFMAPRHANQLEIVFNLLHSTLNEFIKQKLTVNPLDSGFCIEINEMSSTRLWFWFWIRLPVSPGRGSCCFSCRTAGTRRRAPKNQPSHCTVDAWNVLAASVLLAAYCSYCTPPHQPMNNSHFNSTLYISFLQKAVWGEKKHHGIHHGIRTSERQRQTTHEGRRAGERTKSIG